MVVLGGHPDLRCVVRATIQRTTVSPMTPVFFTRLLQELVRRDAFLRILNRTFKIMIGEKFFIFIRLKKQKTSLGVLIIVVFVILYLYV